MGRENGSGVAGSTLARCVNERIGVIGAAILSLTASAPSGIDRGWSKRDSGIGLTTHIVCDG